jgi:hypothetical protein
MCASQSCVFFNVSLCKGCNTCASPFAPFPKDQYGCVGIQRIYIWYRKRQLNDGIRSRSETTFPKDAYIRTSLALFVFSYTQVYMALTSLKALRMIWFDIMRQ